MTGFRPQTTIPAPPARRPLWRRPVVLWLFALLLVLLLAWLFASNEPEPPQSTPVVSPKSAPANEGNLQWEAFPGTTAPTEPPLAMPEEVEAPGRTFIAKLNLQPRLINGRLQGYVVRPDDPSILKGTPLQPGDVLLEVDGLELDPARAAELAENVGDYQDVYIRFERGNVAQEGMLPLGTR